MDRYEEDGLLAVLCDGMGGMAEGGMIAAETASQLVGIFPWTDDSDVPGWVYQRSARVYQQFRGHGGLPWWRPCSKRIASPSGA